MFTSVVSNSSGTTRCLGDFTTIQSIWGDGGGREMATQRDGITKLEVPLSDMFYGPVLGL